jgi:WD40 repeat protein
VLPNGKVLIVGGWGALARTATAELYDPQTGEFNYTASMLGPRAGMTATLLKDGRVLIVGGESARNRPQLVAEIYDPGMNAFVPTGSLNSGRFAHTATLLNDGTVLVAGGGSGGDSVLSGAEIYDPLTGQFRLTGSLSRVRYKHAAILLPDGNVLVMGGSNQNDWQGKYTSTEIYDAKVGTFASAVDLNSERFKLADAVVLLNDGNVLVGGGNRQLEIFDTRSSRFILSKRLDNHYYSAVLTLLKDGRVLITGGYDPGIQPTDQTWIYS